MHSPLDHLPASEEVLQLWGELLKLELQAEIDYFTEKVQRTPLKKRVEEGRCWFPTRVAGVAYATGDKLLVDLERTDGIEARGAFSNGQVVAVFAPDAKGERSGIHQTGIVAQVRRGTMRVAISRNELPHWMEQNTLGIDLYFDETSYREMQTALQQTIRSKKRLKELREVLFGFQAASFSAQPPPREPFPQTLALNASQQAAVWQALNAEDFGVMHGPPGTGKTTTLVAAICETLRREEQVLVTAPSNTAVDVLTERLAAQGVNVIRLGHPVRVSDELQQYTLDEQFVQHRDYGEFKRLKRLAQEMRREAAKFKRNYVRGERGAQFREAGALDSDARHLEQYMLFDLIKNAQVITSTLVGANHQVLGKRRFHTVFIDEAAQSLGPASLIPLLRADRVVFAGDHLQLPPTVKSNEAARKGLSVSLMEHALRQQQRRHHQDVGHMLQVQYRMHQQIMQFSNQKFYRNELQADPSVAQHRLVPEQPPEAWNAPLEFWDTAGCGYQERQNPETLSRYNLEEAQTLLARLHQVLKALEAHAPDRRLTVGLITPYKAQTECVKQVLAEHDFAGHFPHRFRVDTVDGFQGQECDLVAISLVRSNPKGEIGFLGDTRRMNVALTRARQKLIVVGDGATVGQHGFFADLIGYFEQQSAYHSAWELVSAIG